MRLIEIVLFLAPFAVFGLWRLLAPNPRAPLWLVYGVAGFTVLIAASLLLFHREEAGDRGEAYVPAHLQDGRIVPAHRGGGQ